MEIFQWKKYFLSLIIVFLNYKLIKIQIKIGKVRSMMRERNKRNNESVFNRVATKL
ncbi:hypothetical protein C2G38_2090113 [Gigaspora rosea]|uniref:Uncharacterized protein n=1 Tax=Gigaspora rosea TaxID=44941 RepID=A0A397VBR0_9GLOM|nr:hypothetical protein C2G38_2090113 [Gigaspora rosea]